MTSRTGTGLPGGIQVQPAWTDPDLPPDQFLYERLGFWPQPVPAYPMSRPPEVLNIPLIEARIWDQLIGSRHLKIQLGYAGAAVALAVRVLAMPLPDSFNAIARTAVPHIHPLFQAVYPHTTYTLALQDLSSCACISWPSEIGIDRPGQSSDEDFLEVK